MKNQVRGYTSYATESFDRLDDKVRSVGDNMTDAISRFASTGKIKMTEFATSVIQDLIRIQARAAISGLFGQLFGPGVYSKAGFEGAGGIVGIGGIGTKMQHGGYLGEGVVGVGKRSGHSYEFHPNEFVIPSDKMGGGSQVIVNNYSGISATTTERQGADGIKRIFVEIGNDILRGGPIGKAVDLRYGLRPAGIRSE